MYTYYIPQIVNQRYIYIYIHLHIYYFIRTPNNTNRKGFTIRGGFTICGVNTNRKPFTICGVYTNGKGFTICRGFTICGVGCAYKTPETLTPTP